MRIAFLWVLGLLVFAVMAGGAGIALSNSGVDRVYHDTYYVVAHFHYAMTLGLVFLVFAVFYLVIHKWTNRHVPFWAGATQFGLMFVGTLMTFVPQHFLGRQGMPRRYIDYPEAFATWNKISTFGAMLCVLSFVVFGLIVIYLIIWGRTKPS